MSTGGVVLWSVELASWSSVTLHSLFCHLTLNMEFSWIWCDIDFAGYFPCTQMRRITGSPKGKLDHYTINHQAKTTTTDSKHETFTPEHISCCLALDQQVLLLYSLNDGCNSFFYHLKPVNLNLNIIISIKSYLWNLK